MTWRNLAGWLAVAAIAAYALLIAPLVHDVSFMINGAIYASYGILSLSLALIWGYAGILSFGQAAFFGIGGYVYAVAGLNLGETSLAAIIAIAAAAGSAAVLGYIMFWGRVSDVYLGVITLTVSLIFYRFINQTAGEGWSIGVAPLGGFNGIPTTPILAPPGAPDDPLGPEQIYLLSVGALLVCYVLCRLLAASQFGRTLVAIRENETRAELLGYDTRWRKLGVFAIGGALAGAAGVLFANSVFVSPTMFSLQTNGQIIIWVIVGGLGTFTGPVLGCFLLLAFSTWLGSFDMGGGGLDPNLALGVALTICVISLRKGLAPTAAGLGDRLLLRLSARRQPRASLAPTRSMEGEEGA